MRDQLELPRLAHRCAESFEVKAAAGFRRGSLENNRSLFRQAPPDLLLFATCWQRDLLQRGRHHDEAGKSFPGVVRNRCRWLRPLESVLPVRVSLKGLDGLHPIEWSGWGHPLSGTWETWMAPNVPNVVLEANWRPGRTSRRSTSCG